MKLTKYSMAASLLITLGTTALAADDCEVPIERWQPRAAVMQMAAGQGWNVQRLKIDDGCYELRGTDAKGRRFKAKLDPGTLAIVKLKVRERDRKHDRKRSDESRDSTPFDPPDGAGSLDAADPLTSVTLPRKQVN